MNNKFILEQLQSSLALLSQSLNKLIETENKGNIAIDMESFQKLQILIKSTKDLTAEKQRLELSESGDMSKKDIQEALVKAVKDNFSITEIKKAFTIVKKKDKVNKEMN